MDHVQLPQRPRAVERSSGEPGDLLGELVIVARGGQRQLTHMEIEVELGRLDPVGVVERERDLGEAPAERGE